MTRGLLLLAMIVGLAAPACLGGGSSAPPGTQSRPKGMLAVTVTVGRCTRYQMGPCIPDVRRYTLTCGPAGGSMPHAAAACAAIADLERPHTPGGRGCFLLGDVRGLVSTARIHGTFAGSRFALRITSRGSWCGKPRPVMRDYWVLSTFPCSTPVLHPGRADPARKWARASGCGT